MEILKRLGVSVSCLFCSVLAPAGTVWFWATFDYRVSYEIWERVASAWLWIGGALCGIATILFLVGAITSIFIPTKKYLESDPSV